MSALTDEALEKLLAVGLHDSRGELCTTSNAEDQSWGMSVTACPITDTEDVVKALAAEVLALRAQLAAADALVHGLGEDLAGASGADIRPHLRKAFQARVAAYREART